MKDARARARPDHGATHARFAVPCWGGGYADVVWLPTRDRVRLSLGPEFGFLMFGVDGGILLEIDEHGPRPGVTVRPLLSFVFAHAYGRFGRTFDEHGSNFREFGVLLKYPIEL